eukprot:4414284-Pyramimonas_sp.AAC.1
MRTDESVAPTQTVLGTTVGAFVHESVFANSFPTFNSFWGTCSTFVGNGSVQNRMGYWIGPTDVSTII